MKTDAVRIVDRGRGPQLVDRKLTVQDLLPFFKDGTPDGQILRWYPQICQEELDLLRQYYLDHNEEVLALERQVAAQNEQLRSRYAQPPSPQDDLPLSQRLAALRAKLAKRLSSSSDRCHTAGD
jgi:uncharacterized protein (DUF433 family)